MNYACIIPCFNEGDRIKELIRELKNIRSTKIHWFLLDNGSFDSSFDYIFQNKNNKFDKNINFIRKSINEGYGKGIKYALNEIRKYKNNQQLDHIIFNSFSNYSAIGWTHADGQTPLIDFISAANQANFVSSNDYLIKGIRNSREDGFISIIFTSFLNLIIVTFFNRNCINPNSQPTLISMELLFKILENTSNDGTFDLSILLKSTSFKISYLRFPVKFLKRKIGFGANQTFFQKLKYSFKLLSFLWRMRRYSKLFNAI